MDKTTLRTSYFWKIFVPAVLTLLLFVAAYVVIRTPPNMTAPWQTADTVFGNAVTMAGGALRRAVSASAAAARRLK